MLGTQDGDDGRAWGGEGLPELWCSPLCPDQQVEGLHAQVVGAVGPEQKVSQEVVGDVFGRIVARL